jgi:beta-lactamase regulating signal transducer with metallopeptidase domain
VSRAKNPLLYASLCEEGYLYFFFTALVLLELLPAKELGHTLYSQRGIAQQMAGAGHVTATPISKKKKKITGAREVRLKLKKIILSMIIFTFFLYC